MEPKAAADGDEEGEPPPQGAAETERGAQEADETEEAQEGTARAQGRTGQDSESWRVVSVYDTRMAWTKFILSFLNIRDRGARPALQRAAVIPPRASMSSRAASLVLYILPGCLRWATCSRRC